MVLFIGTAKLIALVGLLRTASNWFVSTGRISTNPEDVQFYLYPFNSQPEVKQELILEDLESLEKSNWKFGEKAVFVVHGFWPNITEIVMQDVVKDAYLEADVPYNIVVMDWTHLVTPKRTSRLSPLTALAYFAACDNVPVVAERLARFIAFLVKNQYLTLDQIHIVSHSLGAHLAGHTGKFLEEKFPGQQLGRITGLDPAAPLFDGEVKPHRRLRKEDSKFTDVYHASTATFGSAFLSGHVDFFPNGGKFQPGCKNFNFRKALQERSIIAIEMVCSHNYVPSMYAATIAKEKYPACPCNPLFSFILRCKNCTSNEITAGEHCPTTARGSYYFETGSFL